ncbi:hypothetical protein BU055_02140 [Staphylococcus succinus]|uniref:hypothetical protein n=1 Tax=Staphylococcus succinus TaxID=61015 RepID=UPI000D1E9151|nr:hypothetical protein [Staphylococcus succinus]PTJ85108.1 hypothetical protein BU055_02140 [Staphylococcus succinus]
MQNSAINAAIKARKDLIEQIDYISSIPNETIRSIAKTASLTTNLNSSIKSSLLKAGHVNVINLNTNELITLTRNSQSNLGLSHITKSFNFQRNLFSEEAINSFKKIYRFDDDIVSQAQQNIRDLYINPTAISTLTETINSTYPIKNFQNKANDNKFKKMFLDKNSLPYNGYVKKSGHFVITTDAGNFLTNFINDNFLNVERSLIFVVVALLMYLYSFYPYYKN